MTSSDTNRAVQSKKMARGVKFRIEEAVICVFVFAFEKSRFSHDAAHLAFKTGGCLLVHESNAESSCRSSLCYFQSAISNHLSIVVSMTPEWMVA